MVRLARNVVVGVGPEPYLPDGVTESKRIWHSASLLHELNRQTPEWARRFVVRRSVYRYTAPGLTWELHDDLGDAERGACGAQEIVDDAGYTAVIGHFSSAGAQAAALPLYRRAVLPVLPRPGRRSRVDPGRRPRRGGVRPGPPALSGRVRTCVV
ncbi:SidA/IucD/PvdA family monooxygenase [Streptomyces sp. NPDC005065]|uniref:SidA/IucD/PvdA family monooxygenase n=1 Tax=unclassified Streptomyces TaxID=2593676 RepID=UPI0033B46D65